MGDVRIHRHEDQMFLKEWGDPGCFTKHELALYFLFQQVWQMNAGVEQPRA